MRSTRLSLGRVLRAETRDFYVLLGLTLFLVIFGLVMVLSSSSVESHHDFGDFYARFASQGGFAVIGVVLMLIASRLPARFWERTIWVFLGVACLLQIIALTTPLGVKIGDNTNWLRIGPIAGQPSEAIKLCLVVWLGIVLARKRHVLHEWRQLAVPILPVAGGSILLVVLGGDLGTTVIMAAFVLGALFFAGARLKHLGVAVATVSVAAVLIAVSSETRRGRIAAFFGGTSAVNPDVDWQLNNGHYALASGGVFGVGLGNSHSKWSWLPSADTDFIFAIIGEELGLIGALLVVLLFGMLATVLVRMTMRTGDPAARVTTAAIMVWLIGQAFVNIGVVLGLIPVLGVPLPLVSAGGTALVSSLIAVGIVLSFTRRSGDGRTPMAAGGPPTFSGGSA